MHEKLNYRPDLDVRIRQNALTALTVEWVKNHEQIPPLAGPWTALEQEVRNRTHLSTFDFLSTWYKHYAGAYGGMPLIGLAWRGKRLVGVAPLSVRRGKLGGVPVTRIEFAPTDTPAGEFLVEDANPEIAAVMVESLVRNTRFDVMCLDAFDPASPQLKALQQMAAKLRLVVKLTDHAYALADCRNGYEAYRSTLSGHYRRNLKNRTTRIDAAGGATFGGVQLTEGLDRLEDALHRMIAINEASYKLRGQRLGNNHRAYLAELVRKFGDRGMLSLPILSIGGKDAAFILGLVERGCFYDLTLSYVEAFEKFSPGAVLMQKTLEQLAAAGVHTVVSHGAHEYKKHWATRFVPQKRLFLFAPGARAAAARFMRFSMAPVWRRVGLQEAEI